MATQPGSTPDATRFAYVGSESFEDGDAIRGGILIIDSRGIPHEFRCTSPVRPNAVQRITYGHSLEPFILVELIGTPLIKGCQERPDVVLFDECEFLGVRNELDMPVAYLRKQGSELSGHTDSSTTTSKLIDSPSGDFDPVVVETYKEYEHEAQSIVELLQQLATHIDVLEPFERLKRALAKVHEEKALDQA